MQTGLSENARRAGFMMPAATGFSIDDATAILVGMFGEWPDARMLAGSAIVVATGRLSFCREQRLALPEQG